MPTWSEVATTVTSVTGLLAAVWAIVNRRRTLAADRVAAEREHGVDSNRLNLEAHRVIVEQYQGLYATVSNRLGEVEEKLDESIRREATCEANLAVERRKREDLEQRVEALGRRIDRNDDA